MIGIYAIISPKKAVYIGLSRDIERRWREHKSHTQKKGLKLNHSIQKYGYDKHIFKVIQELPIDVSVNVLNKLETVCYEIFKAAGFKMLNVMPTGINYIDYKNTARNDKLKKVATGRKQSEAQKEKTRARMLTYKHSEKTKAKIALANSKRIWKPESRLKRSVLNAGNSFHLGKFHTPESIQKMKDTKAKK